MPASTVLQAWTLILDKKHVKLVLVMSPSTWVRINVNLLAKVLKYITLKLKNVNKNLKGKLIASVLLLNLSGTVRLSHVKLALALLLSMISKIRNVSHVQPIPHGMRPYQSAFQFAIPLKCTMKQPTSVFKNQNVSKDWSWTKQLRNVKWYVLKELNITL